MRHGNRVKHLGRPADQRKALIRSLVTEVLRHGQIRTTKVGTLQQPLVAGCTLPNGKSCDEFVRCGHSTIQPVLTGACMWVALSLRATSVAATARQELTLARCVLGRAGQGHGDPQVR